MPDESRNPDTRGPDPASPAGVPRPVSPGGARHPVATADQAGDRGGGLTEAPAVPIPPRFWWLKRLSTAALVFLLLLVGVRLWWGHVAESRLQAKIAEYRAAGQPVLLEDFRPEPIPDEENGAYFLMLAPAKLTRLRKARDVPLEPGDFIWDLQHDRQHLETVRQFVQSNAEALRLVHEARSKTATDWTLNWSAPVLALPLPNVAGHAGQRLLAKATNLAALHHHVTGNDAEAVESLRDALAIGRHIDGRPGVFLISHLVRMGTDTLTVHTIEPITAGLCITDNVSTESQDAGPATRAQVRVLIQDLLDEADFADAWTHCFFAKRMYLVDTMQQLFQGGVGLSGMMGGATVPALVDRAAVLLVGPAWKLDAIRAMKYYTGFAKVSAAPSWPAAAAAAPPLPEPGSLPEKAAAPWSQIMLPSFDLACRSHFVALAVRRLAATALAIRSYELDHGQRPHSLAELVPDYLTSVPLDPFDADNGELRYLPGAPSPLLYSVSLNGVDEGGKFAGDTPDDVEWLTQDLPFFLNGDRPQREPYWHAASTQAVEDDE